jgi:hypothetical protein
LRIRLFCQGDDAIGEIAVLGGEGAADVVEGERAFHAGRRIARERRKRNTEIPGLHFPETTPGENIGNGNGNGNRSGICGDHLG